LRHYDGHGAVRLLDADSERGALLLEQAEPGTAASSVTPQRDIVATAAIITVMLRLHKPAPEGVALPDLLARDQESFVDHLRRHPGDTPLPRRLVTRAMGLAAELTADVVTPVVLHGDLHHGNVLRGTREPWLAIDPHGAVGDPVAEVGAMLYNPDPPRRDRSLLDLVPSRIEQLADGLGVAQERVVAWGFVHAVLSEVWTAENPDEPVTRALDVALLLEPRLG
jgi:streptomycin 6-kinase